MSSSCSILGFHWFCYRQQCLGNPIFCPCFPNIFAFCYCMIHIPNKAGRVRELNELNGGPVPCAPNWTEQTFQTNWCLANWMYWTDAKLVMAQNIPCSFISFFHNKGIFCYFCSFLVDSGHFQLTSTTSTTFLLVELVGIEHGHYIVSCSYRQPRGGCFSYFWGSLNGCAMPPTYLRFPTLLVLNIY